MLPVLVVGLLLVVIVQLHGIGRLLEKSLVSQGAEHSELFAAMLDEALEEPPPTEGWGQLRDEARKMAGQGVAVATIARTLGLGQGEVQLLLNLEDNPSRGLKSRPPRSI